MFIELRFSPHSPVLVSVKLPDQLDMAVNAKFAGKNIRSPLPTLGQQQSMKYTIFFLVVAQLNL